MQLLLKCSTMRYLLLLVLTFRYAVADLSSDVSALLSFAATVPHGRKLNWQSDHSICTSWIGITCSDDGARVVGIHLPGVGLSGYIPENTLGKLDALQVLSLRANLLRGDLPHDILSIPSLQSVFLQNNNFSGSIPSNLSSRLSVIDLSSNSFSGEIPLALSNLKRLSVLNLQFNSFSGQIPDFNLPKLSVLNLSHNLFSGSIPSYLGKFPVSSFTGNDHLCGPPLDICSNLAPTSQSSSSSIHGGHKPAAKFSSGAIIAMAIGGASFLTFALLAIAFCYLKRRESLNTTLIVAKAPNADKDENLKKPTDFETAGQPVEKNKLVFFERCSLNFDLEDMLRASAEILGKGSYGTAYKAILDEATVVVVKRLKDLRIGRREFEQQMEIVNRHGRHPNLLPLLAYYFSKDEKLLVYPYMPCGSLHTALHGNRSTERALFQWDSRLNVSLGAAKGLAHIHSQDGGKYVHGNIKSSNIILTGNSDDCCVSDFGLRCMTSYISIAHRVVGYRAPETIETQTISQKSDIYSFGVLLLEMLTGKSPLQCSGHNDMVDLPRWVRSVVREEWTAEVFDEELLKLKNIEEELVQMLQIALSCVAKLPEMRPTMVQVVRMIEEIRPSDHEYRLSSDNVSKDSNAPTP